MKKLCAERNLKASHPEAMERIRLLSEIQRFGKIREQVLKGPLKKCFHPMVGKSNEVTQKPEEILLTDGLSDCVAVTLWVAPSESHEGGRFMLHLHGGSFFDHEVGKAAFEGRLEEVKDETFGLSFGFGSYWVVNGAPSYDRMAGFLNQELTIGSESTTLRALCEQAAWTRIQAGSHSMAVDGTGRSIALDASAQILPDERVEEIRKQALEEFQMTSAFSHGS